MSKYLFQASLTAEGVKVTVRDGGSKRKAAIEQLIGSVGGNVEAFYYAFGETDLFVICDMPDNASAIAAVLAVVSAGTAEVKTAVLLTPEEVDAAVKKSPAYTPPAA